MTTALAPRASTLFLKAVLVCIASAVLAACVFSFPGVWNGAAAEWPALQNVLYPGLAAIYLTLLPFLFALSQAFLLLRYIDKDEAFSVASIRALRNILWSAVAMSALYACAMPLIFAVAQLDDAPGLALLGGAWTCAPLVVATFAAVLRKLVQSALDLKTEQEFTV